MIIYAIINHVSPKQILQFSSLCIATACWPPSRQDQALHEVEGQLAMVEGHLRRKVRGKPSLLLLLAAQDH